MRIQATENFHTYNGELEFIFRDEHKRVIKTHREHNIVKIFAKEMLAHRLPHSRVWDVHANSGMGGWVTHNLDLEEFSAKYIVFGASFDGSGNPLGNTDPRYYTHDSITNGYMPISLGSGAAYDGGLINAIPVAEPNRPLKRIERIFFESSYQPPGTPLLQSDVRAINNVLVMETTLLKSEYNGFGVNQGDFFTITEVALVGAAEIDSIGSVECDPRQLFLLGSNGQPLSQPFLANASGASTISLDPSETNVDVIREGDQIKITASDDADDDLDQVSSYYLVTAKAVGGRDITLDRTPVDSNGDALVGDIGVLRDGFRIFSHRVLKAPFQKSAASEVTVRWRIILG